jgi:hypothetical protein
MLARGVADVGGSAIRLHFQQGIEVDCLALRPQPVGPLLRRLELRLLRTRHAPSHADKLTLAGQPIPHDRRQQVRKEIEFRLEVANKIAQGARHLLDGFLIGSDVVQITHEHPWALPALYRDGQATSTLASRGNTLPTPRPQSQSAGCEYQAGAEWALNVS